MTRANIIIRSASGWTPRVDPVALLQILAERPRTSWIAPPRYRFPCSRYDSRASFFKHVQLAIRRYRLTTAGSAEDSATKYETLPSATIEREREKERTDNSYATARISRDLPAMDLPNSNCDFCEYRGFWIFETKRVIHEQFTERSFKNLHWKIFTFVAFLRGFLTLTMRLVFILKWEMEIKCVLFRYFMF